METVKGYELKAFFTYVIEVLESLGIPYMVVGGFAAIFYGEPRLTIDVDIVVDMKPDDIDLFLRAFPIPDYYISEEGVRDALQRRYPFNIIQPATGAKVDLVPLPSDRFTKSAFEQRQRLTYDETGRSATFITAEDILIAKLLAYRETGSDKHLRDARGVLVTQWGEIDLDRIRRGARASGVLDRLEEILAMIQTEMEE